MSVNRPDWDTYMMRLAYLAATRATCDRKHVGALIVTPDRRVVATGYNGAPAGVDSCDEVGHQMVDNHCVRTLHAESNALDFAGRFAQGCTLYVTVTPCWDCAKRIVNANIDRVVYDEHYESRYGKSMDVPDYLRTAGVTVERFDENRMARFKTFLSLVDTPADALIVSPEVGAVLRSTPRALSPRQGDYVELVDEQDEQGLVRICDKYGSVKATMPRRAYEKLLQYQNPGHVDTSNASSEVCTSAITGTETL